MADERIVKAKLHIPLFPSNISELANDVPYITAKEFDDLEARVAANEVNIGNLQLEKVDSAYVEEGIAHFCSGDQELFAITGIGGGGGGGEGGGANNAKLTVTNTTGWLSRAQSEGADCWISINWSSIEEESETGPGTLTVTVGANAVANKSVTQGDVRLNVGSYLAVGSNRIKFAITDAYGNVRSIIYTVISVSAVLSSSFDDTVTYPNAISFPYICTGSGSKTVYFILDGASIGEETVKTSGRQSTFTIPAPAYGAHELEVYFATEVDGAQVESNHLFFSIMAVDEEATEPIISISHITHEIAQYGTLNIPFQVYDPSSLVAAVTVTATGSAPVEMTVDRTRYTYSFRALAVGTAIVEFKVGDISETVEITVMESSANIYAETQGLTLYLTSAGRSNAAANRNEWTSSNVAAQMTDFNFVSDGWVRDSEGNTVLRVAGDARVIIPFHPFAEDFRTTGKTIEIEFATHNVLNYDAEIISCMNDGRGFKLTAQMASMSSEQSSISTQYKEDDHIRVSFVVEKRSENRLMYIYINSIMSGVIQYPENDDFSQPSPVNISIGSSLCAVDIYNIRIYDNDLTRFQILGNWIADTQNVEDMLDRYSRNDVFDDYGEIVISKLPADLPYLTLTAPTLPQYKGDKKNVAVAFVDPQGNFINFTSPKASANVQGTSSQYYPRKNYKVSFKDGFLINGVTVAVYEIRPGAIGTKEFTYKADVASSEGANNVELARLYNDACPDRTPPQENNPAVRQTIDGFPIVMFQNDGDSTEFIGKYNFNNDKGTPEVYGFSTGDESWEIKNNTSSRVLFKNADFSGSDWENDFEGSYPDGYTNTTRLAAMCQWVASTDGNPEKFKAELADWFSVDSCLFYYLFTELFLMVDSRAKNAFPTYWHTDGKWRWRLYDADTALGINNEGALVFGYELEDTDHLASGADVFNGQQSVFWVNMRLAFADELKTMYQQLRTGDILSYPVVEGRFEEHQSKWPEAVFNEDSYYKYIRPLTDEGSGAYLSMLQGSKLEQRRWWLYNRFRYIDSKYNAGDALTDYIVIRGYAKANITVTPYAHVYAAVKYGSYLVSTRALRGSSYTLECPLGNVNDTEIMIFSASQLANVGDLSGFMVGFADFSAGTRLQCIKIGDPSSSYSNGNLTELHLGNNIMLKTLDVRNCPNLRTAIDVSGCTNLEEAYFDGTSITALSVANGGVLRELHLPSTITNLTILNQPNIETFSVPSYANVTTLRLENVGLGVDSRAILNAIPASSRVRLIGFYWTCQTEAEVIATMDILDTMRGLDENGNNTPKAQLSGTIFMKAATGAAYASVKERYPDIRFEYEHITSVLHYMNFNGTAEIYSETIVDGGDGAYDGIPARASTAQYDYTFSGWSYVKDAETNDPEARKSVIGDRYIYAAYARTIRKYTVRFINGATVLETVYNVPYGGSAAYSGTTPSHMTEPDHNAFIGWSPSPENITGDTDCYAQYRNTGAATLMLLDKTITGAIANSAVTRVGKHAFCHCTKLTDASFPQVSYIGERAFYSCSALSTVRLSVVSSIETEAFADCTSLESVYILAPSVCQGTSNMFANTPMGTSVFLDRYGSIYVPASLVDAYKSATIWHAYADRFVSYSED